MAYDPNNIFARILRGETQAHKVWEDSDTIAILDVMPQSDGHTLVIPKAAAENIFELDTATAEAVIRTGQQVALAVRTAFKPDGITLMQSMARSPADGIPFHLPVVPRYAGSPRPGAGGFCCPYGRLRGCAQRLTRSKAEGGSGQLGRPTAMAPMKPA